MMNLMFIQGGSRLKLSDKGIWYTDPNFTEEVWGRYLAHCSHLTILLRKEKKIYTDEECINRFNPIPISSKISVVALEDFVQPKLNLINPLVRGRIRKQIFESVQNVDKVIIRSASYYTGICMKACLYYRKPYLVEVTGFVREGMMHHSLLGKLSAVFFEKLAVDIAKNAEAAIYVTDEALQKRYPCKKMLGCSDVVLQSADEKILEKRLKKIAEKKSCDIVRLGTAAFLDVKWKGQHNVIRAIAELKKKGIINILYEMIGSGTGDRLKKLSEELGVSSQVKILGIRPHREVFAWLDDIDIYIQPSYQEGLCRAIAEAISRACPVIASDAGGNYELVNNKFIFPCGEYKTLASLIEKMMLNSSDEAKRNFDRSKHYSKIRLDGLRNSFLQEFMNYDKE